MAQGMMKWFDRMKGLGLIAPDDGGGDLFARFSAVSVEAYRSLATRQRVEFVPMRCGAGLQAHSAAAL